MSAQINALRERVHRLEAWPPKHDALDRSVARMQAQFEHMGRTLEEVRADNRATMSTVQKVDRDLLVTKNEISSTVEKKTSQISSQVQRMFWTGAGFALALTCLVTGVQVYLSIFKG